MDLNSIKPVRSQSSSALAQSRFATKFDESEPPPPGAGPPVTVTIEKPAAITAAEPKKTIPVIVKPPGPVPVPIVASHPPLFSRPPAMRPFHPMNAVPPPGFHGPPPVGVYHGVPPPRPHVYTNPIAPVPYPNYAAPPPQQQYHHPLQQPPQQVTAPLFPAAASVSSATTSAPPKLTSAAKAAQKPAFKLSDTKNDVVEDDDEDRITEECVFPPGKKSTLQKMLEKDPDEHFIGKDLK